MTEPRDFSKDVDALRDELAALRADYARVAGRSDAHRQWGAVKDEISSAIETLRARISKEAGDASEAIGKDIDELAALVEGYTARARKTAAANPLSSLLGAVAIGFLLGRIVR